MRFCFSAVLFCLAGLFLNAGSASPTTQPVINARFSPDGGCTDTIVAAVGAAKDKIYVQAYVLTSPEIAKALVNAKQRGVAVEVIIDGRGSKTTGSQYTWLKSQGVNCVLDKKHPIAHNKVILIDGKKVITGSFNFSAQAEKANAENLLEITDEPLTKVYEANWNLHRKHSLAIGEEKEEEPQETPPMQEDRKSTCSAGKCGIYSPPRRLLRR